MNLTIINYSMRSNNVVFSHQRDTVIALSKYFQSITVFTLESSDEPLPANVKISQITWKSGSHLENIFRILTTLLPHLLSNRKQIVFSHMTDAHAAAISPITWFLRIKHVLWYAHAKNSIFLIFSSIFVSKILSSTKGSCTLKINRRKIFYLNQGIDESQFPFLENHARINNMFYYGRLDASKQIHSLIELVTKLHSHNMPFTLHLFGRPMNDKSKHYMEELIKNNASVIEKEFVIFQPPLMRKEIAHVAAQYGLFLNLFSGSLDKTLIECTFLGLPVVTWNIEYCSQFGTWTNRTPTPDLDFILSEIYSILNLNEYELKNQLSIRRDLALRLHSFDGWITRLASILSN